MAQSVKRPAGGGGAACCSSRGSTLGDIPLRSPHAPTDGALRQELAGLKLSQLLARASAHGAVSAGEIDAGTMSRPNARLSRARCRAGPAVPGMHHATPRAVHLLGLQQSASAA